MTYYRRTKIQYKLLSSAVGCIMIILSLFINDAFISFGCFIFGLIFIIIGYCNNDNKCIEATKYESNNNPIASNEV